MQKMIRRGMTHCAMRFAVQLHDVDAVYFWRRLAITALEDVGFGDPLACALALESNRSHRFRQQLGERHVLAAIVTSLAEATKSRALCDALVVRGNQPTKSRAFRAHTQLQAVPWVVKFLATRGFSNADLGPQVLPVWDMVSPHWHMRAKMNSGAGQPPPSHLSVKVVEHEPDDLGNELIGEFPAAAYCALYTVEGKRAAAYLSRCVPFRDRYDAKQVAMAIWHVEGAFLDRTVGNVELAALSLEAKLRDWLSVGLSDTAKSVELQQLVTEYRPLLNRVRERVIGV